MVRNIGAGDGNRTRVASLENSNSAIELHPRRLTNLLYRTTSEQDKYCNRTWSVLWSVLAARQPRTWSVHDSPTDVVRLQYFYYCSDRVR